MQLAASPGGFSRLRRRGHGCAGVRSPFGRVGVSFGPARPCGQRYFGCRRDSRWVRRRGGGTAVAVRCGRRSVRRKNGGTVGGRLFCLPRPPAVSPGGAAGSGKGYHPRAPIASYGFVTLTGTVQCGNRYRLLHSAVRPAVSSSSIRLILVFDRQVPSSSPPQQ